MLTRERLDQIRRDVVDPSVHAMLVDASEMAQLLLCVQALDEAHSWMRRAVCFIGAAANDEPQMQAADELIHSAHVLLTTGPVILAEAAAEPQGEGAE